MDQEQQLPLLHLRKANRYLITLVCLLTLTGIWNFNSPDELITQGNGSPFIGAMDALAVTGNSQPETKETDPETETKTTPEPEADPAPAQQSSNQQDTQQANTSPVYDGNRYAWGHCTWHVANLRKADGQPIPSFWGNAGQWGYSAEADGYTVNQTPKPGAIAWQEGGYGHVAYILSVDGNRVTVSEMNGLSARGVTRQNSYHISNFSGFIH